MNLIQVFLGTVCLLIVAATIFKSVFPLNGTGRLVFNLKNLNHDKRRNDRCNYPIGEGHGDN